MYKCLKNLPATMSHDPSSLRSNHIVLRNYLWASKYRAIPSEMM